MWDGRSCFGWRYLDPKGMWRRDADISYSRGWLMVRGTKGCKDLPSRLTGLLWGVPFLAPAGNPKPKT